MVQQIESAWANSSSFLNSKGNSLSLFNLNKEIGGFDSGREPLACQPIQNYKNLIKGFIGKYHQSHMQLLFHSKSIVYSFKDKNNKYSVFSSTKIIESLLETLFLSISSLISKPIYLIRQDKIIIRLFVFLAPKIDRTLHTSLCNKKLWNKISNIQMKLSFRRAINEYLNVKKNDLNISLDQTPLVNHKNLYGTDPRLNSYLVKFKNKLEIFGYILGTILNKKVEFEIIKLQFPFHDSKILSHILGYNANTYKFTRIISKLFPKAVIKNPSQDILFMKEKKDELLESKNNIDLLNPHSYLPPLFDLSNSNSKWISKKINTNTYPSYLSGINIKLAGRLMTQSIRPRFTVQNKQSGSLARLKIDFIERSRFTGKNKRGAFSFTVSIGHVITK